MARLTFENVTEMVSRELNTKYTLTKETRGISHKTIGYNLRVECELCWGDTNLVKFCTTLKEMVEVIKRIKKENEEKGVVKMNIQKWVNGRGEELEIVPVVNINKYGNNSQYFEDVAEYQNVEMKDLLFIEVDYMNQFEITAHYKNEKKLKYVMYEMNKYNEYLDLNI